MSVSALGATVPAFSGITVVAPNEVTLTVPFCSGFDCGSVSRTADMTLSWTGGSSTKVNAQLFTFQTGQGGRSITCTFSASPGTVPAAAMAKLEQTGGAVSGFLYVRPLSSTSFVAGSWGVTVTAAGTATLGNLAISN